MTGTGFDLLRSAIAGISAVRRIGRVTEIGSTSLWAAHLSDLACLGDQVTIRGETEVPGEVISVRHGQVQVMPVGRGEGIRVGSAVTLQGPAGIAPAEHWIGRLIDPMGRPLDGRALLDGLFRRGFRGPPPPPAERRGLGERLDTGIAVFNTLLPLVRGQRIGIFAGSGVGKSMLLGRLARDVAADAVVVALIGERGREVRDFVDKVLGPGLMARSVVVAATSDQPALLRRRCAHTALTVAECLRDQGLHVLLLADSVTRFAEAHREIAAASGEPASLRGFPPSTGHEIMSLAERAGPGADRAGCGDITAVFTVLVAGSDMDEPVADMLRGVLDGHVVLDRAIAERGRYPPVDLLRSVSRALPAAATEAENHLIADARRLLGAYDRAELMIQAGLYTAGSDPLTDRAIRLWPALDAFLAEDAPAGVAASFARLQAILAP